MGGSRHALVVANDEYADPGLGRLAAPGYDADALAAALRDPAVGGFEVQVVRNASAHAVHVAVDDFFADRAPEDLLLLHFSCHGLKNGAGELFLASVDTRPTRLASTSVAADFVNRQMADSRAQRIALFLDCCYGGAFQRGMVIRAAQTAEVRDAFVAQDDIGNERGRVVVTASSAMQYAFEGDHLTANAEPGPSVFTAALVEGLTSGDADRDGDGWIGLTELFEFVSDRVRRMTPHQTPQMWFFGAHGDMRIARTRVRRIKATPLPTEIADAVTSTLPMIRYGAAEELRVRLIGDDLSQALASWQALNRMIDDDSRKVADAVRLALASVALHVTPKDLALVVVGDHAEGELQLDGPPLALCATATTAEPWLHIEQDGQHIRVSAELGTSDASGSILLTGPIAEPIVVPVVAPTRPVPPKVKPPPQTARRHWRWPRHLRAHSSRARVILVGIVGLAALLSVMTAVLLVAHRKHAPQTGVGVTAPFSKYLDGHRGGVRSVAFDPADSNKLASGGRDGTVRLWDVASGKLALRPLIAGKDQKLVTAAFSRKGTLLASGSRDGTVRLWNAHTGLQQGADLRTDGDPVLGLAFSPDDKTLVSGDDHGNVRFWNTSTGQQMGEPLKAGTDKVARNNVVEGIAFDPHDGGILATGRWDGTVQLWNTNTRQPIGPPLDADDNAVYTLAFSPDGRFLASGGGNQPQGIGTVRVWNVATRTPIDPLIGHTDVVIGVAFNPAGNILASSSWDHTARLWDTATGRALASVPGDNKTQFEGVAFSPNGEVLAAGSGSTAADAPIWLWNVKSGS